MADIDFMELATYCQNRYKEKHNTIENKYVKTLFVAITKEGTVLTSTTPHVLRNAEQCILIHESSELAVTRYYSWYHVEFIDKTGEVYDERLDGKFTLQIGACGGYADQEMWLDYGKNTIYSCRTPWEKNIVKIWNLYSRVKDLQSAKEINIIADLFKKDEKILELEKQVENFKFTNHLLEQERNQYKSLLDEVKQIIDKK